MDSPSPGGGELERLMQLLARIPGLGPRSARRAALHLMRKREALLVPLAEALTRAAANVRRCGVCGNLDSTDPCAICRDARRDTSILCVVEDVADLWALERAGAYRGRYHVLGGTLSALDGVNPDDLAIPSLLARARSPEVHEVILATNATVEGQTTAHYIADRLIGNEVKVTALAHGMPMGGELDYLDDGTLGWAIKSRHPVS
ncbi:MAG: recombination protein RecR [Alphaproteobacteria bacterium]|nr:recombination protein RecR [Alphaproteobacteria bacterium]